MKRPHIVTYAIHLIVLAGLLGATASAQAWTIHITGEGGEIGARASDGSGRIDGRDVFTGDAGNTRFTDEQAYSGDRALKLTIEEGSTGFGSFGGIVKFANYDHAGGKKLVKGDEVWVRVRLWFPEGFEFNQGRNKFLRFRTYHMEGEKKVGEGHNDLYINGHPEQDNFAPFWYIFEGEQRWRKCGSKEHYFTFGEWKTVEYYLKLDNVKAAEGGEARVLVWVDGELIADIDDRRTLNRDDSFIDSMYFFTWWGNDGARKTQSLYVDDLTITSDTPANKDEQGNPYIGMGGAREAGEDMADVLERATITVQEAAVKVEVMNKLPARIETVEG